MALSDEIKRRLNEQADASPGVLAQAVGEKPTPTEIFQTLLSTLSATGDALVKVAVVVDALSDVIAADPELGERFLTALRERQQAIQS